MKFKFIIKITLIFILCSIGINAYANKSYQLSTIPRALTTEEKNMIIEATKIFLGDTYKAQFDSLEFIWPEYNGNEYGGYCGLVNFKNIKGNYLGYNPFILYFNKNKLDEVAINYVGTPREEDISIGSNDFFFNICKNKKTFKYDLKSLLDKKANVYDIH